MEKIEIKSEENEILAIIARKVSLDSLKNGMHIFTNENDIIQAGFLKREKGYKSKPHYHPLVKQPVKGYRQEVMYVIDGKVRLTIYTSKGEKVASINLAKGDLAIIYQGHRVEFIEDSLLLEIKQGPYPGLHEDKIILGEN
ncbi:MAG: hypothetical protein B6U95_06400 [Thermofilum sp. ex4484_82]|nr:MAG: hypothetical protein B6U95_06400 [Thermofilum sp. ex4484_82]OYT37533.1 MAG: hypothetical protein B6U96_06390 [Archaeoglobales archaeon ex4484_92]